MYIEAGDIGAEHSKDTQPEIHCVMKTPTILESTKFPVFAMNWYRHSSQ
jgi:hypothetical protein